jgi:hypothetical protein
MLDRDPIRHHMQRADPGAGISSMVLACQARNRVIHRRSANIEIVGLSKRFHGRAASQFGMTSAFREGRCTCAIESQVRTPPTVACAQCSIHPRTGWISPRVGQCTGPDGCCSQAAHGDAAPGRRPVVILAGCELVGPVGALLDRLLAVAPNVGGYRFGQVDQMEVDPSPVRLGVPGGSGACASRISRAPFRVTARANRDQKGICSSAS